MQSHKHQINIRLLSKVITLFIYFDLANLCTFAVYGKVKTFNLISSSKI